MSTAVIAGTIAFPVVTTGPSTSVYLGSPTISSDSSTGTEVSYGEGITSTLSIATGSPVAVPMSTIASGSVFYVGSNQPVDLILDGGAETISIAAGGWVMFAKCGIATATLTATTSTATVTFVVLGD